METQWIPPNKFRCYAEELAGVPKSVISPASVQDRSSGEAVVHASDTTARDNHHLLEGELTYGKTTQTEPQEAFEEI